MLAGDSAGSHSQPERASGERASAPLDSQQSCWVIPEGARTVVPASLVRIVVERREEVCPKTGVKTEVYAYDARTRISAAQALVAMHRQIQTEQTNGQRDESPSIADSKQRQRRLLALAEQLRTAGMDGDIDSLGADSGA